MNNKGVGAVLCLTAALLMAARYLSAALYMSHASTWSAELFQSALHYVGSPLKIAAILSLAAGVLFLAWGLYRDDRRSK